LTEKSSQTPSNKQDNEVMKILNLRYAKGEITKEEFNQMKEDINE